MLRGNVPALLDLMHLERIDDDLFRGRSPDGRDGRVYGGQVAAQATLAAQRTVDPEWPVHSLHSYFLRPGDPRRPILYQVERIRDGRSFATRRIVALQHGRAIFSLDASFQQREQGYEHQAPMPEVPAPETLPHQREQHAEMQARHPQRAAEFAWVPRPFDFRWIGTPWLDFVDEPQAPEMFCWFRLARPLAPSELAAFEDLPATAIHAALLVYASDHTILDTALRPHAGSFQWSGMQIASLDHAMWFHHDVDVSDWILYAQDAPSSAAGRGCSRGSLYSRDGRLLGSAIQESLMRSTGPGEG
ncbi:MAG TPA: acyl-CoA thioesterase II [Pseudomonadales bacterium]|nr:acyl-CoA thioesterase II [Pseudomonadales bacterium]